ncbi:Glycerol-3-phosphate regulon repressor [Jannaschia seosinensis]|uniref:Glycerol-3-phosphate regulon repressor n=1 Tax=Jannaschia seosinensis TaxID=313367 RepID=A0A0M7BAT5_9RHOB|nr:DeoR/GlpR family DNA-binding transcription regulator [Jannaschia seosinensis]CUH38934.1 Glycerol-3-phosphate regulon repressor [Jannaschia seosinensis]
MSQTIRHPEILDIARRDGKVSVDGLAAHFGVTLQTIRRDLADLAEAGRLERVHGGAVLPSGTSNIAYEERRRLNAEGKAAMARACAARIPEDCAVFLNIGTSTEAVAAALIHHRNLMVVTNNMNVAAILAHKSDCDVIVTGGRLRHADGGLVGTLAREAVGRFKFDVAVIGCSALDADGEILDYDVQEVGVSQAILARARRTMLLADHMKLSRTAPARIASLADVDEVFTDRDLPPALALRCAEWGTRVKVACAEA